MSLFRKGAEADLYLDDLNGLKIIRKARKVKSYRLPAIDLNIRRERTFHEAQIMHGAKLAGVPTPTIYLVDLKTTTIVMEYIDGTRVKEFIKFSIPSGRKKICEVLGQLIGRLHLRGIIHGDLTTSNLIIDKYGKIFLIDFGLAEYSEELEKRGVDLLLAKRALYSTHYDYAKHCFDAVIDGYTRTMGYNMTEEVIKRVEAIEKRGRYAVER